LIVPPVANRKTSKALRETEVLDRGGDGLGHVNCGRHCAKSLSSETEGSSERLRQQRCSLRSKITGNAEVQHAMQADGVVVSIVSENAEGPRKSGGTCVVSRCPFLAILSRSHLKSGARKKSEATRHIVSQQFVVKYLMNFLHLHLKQHIHRAAYVVSVFI
jgi:hypothetical protein